jgi:hypothetical protein
MLVVHRWNPLIPLSPASSGAFFEAFIPRVQITFDNHPSHRCHTEAVGSSTTDNAACLPGVAGIERRRWRREAKKAPASLPLPSSGSCGTGSGREPPKTYRSRAGSCSSSRIASVSSPRRAPYASERLEAARLKSSSRGRIGVCEDQY